jgi:tripartite-type tricarboxylate transporter receptor subunit TctC
MPGPTPASSTFAIGSVSSAGHPATELLKRGGGGDYTIVPYKGSAPAYQDPIGGQISGFVDPVLGAVQHHKAGDLRILAVTSSTRLPTLPGRTHGGREPWPVTGNSPAGTACWGPAKLPPEITQRLNAETNRALAGDMKERLLSQGILLGGGSVAEFGKFRAGLHRRHWPG